MNMNKTKTTRGRQKIEIKKIQKVENRQVTFTKRRGGLFKKAAELCILTAADVAVIVKSPGGRTFAFGHSSVEAVVDRYLGGKGSPKSAMTEDLTREFSEWYDDVTKDLAAEKRRKEMILESNVPNIGFWWQEPIETLPVWELESYVASLERLKEKLTMRANEMHMRASNCMQYSPPAFAINPNNENSSEFAYHFINQPHDSTSINSLVP